MLILGVDPGSRVTGYGLVSYKDSKISYVTSGVIHLRSKDFDQRLLMLYDGLHELLDHYKPDYAAIESLFVHKNAASAIKLGQARGVAYLALAKHHCDIKSYSPREIKLAVTGHGGALKSQVQSMVSRILSIGGQIQSDSADALAMAICDINNRHRYKCNLI